MNAVDKAKEHSNVSFALLNYTHFRIDDKIGLIIAFVGLYPTNKKIYIS